MFGTLSVPAVSSVQIDTARARLDFSLASVRRLITSVIASVFVLTFFVPSADIDTGLTGY